MRHSSQPIAAAHKRCRTPSPVTVALLTAIAAVAMLAVRSLRSCGEGPISPPLTLRSAPWPVVAVGGVGAVPLMSVAGGGNTPAQWRARAAAATAALRGRREALMRCDDAAFE